MSDPDQCKDGSLRRFIRSNAMRTHRRKEKEKAILERAQKDVLTNRGNECPYLALTAKDHNDILPGSEDSVVRTQTLLPAATEPLVMRDAYGDKPSLKSLSGHSTCNDRARKSSLPLQEPVISNPKRLIGDGMSDPFNAYPSSGYPTYNSYMLNHCEKPICQRFSPSVHCPLWQFSTHLCLC